LETVVCNIVILKWSHHVCVKALVPNLGVNYPNLVMGPFVLGNGLFLSISVLTTTYFIEHTLAGEEQIQPLH